MRFVVSYIAAPVGETLFAMEIPDSIGFPPLPAIGEKVSFQETGKKTIHVIQWRVIDKRHRITTSKGHGDGGDLQVDIQVMLEVDI